MVHYFDMTGKVAVITGGSRFIGHVYTMALARHVSELAILATKMETLLSTKEEVETQFGKKCMAVQCDLTDEIAIRSAVQQIYKEFGHIDILVNNAGIAVWEHTLEHSTENMDKIFAVDLRAALILCREVGAIMAKQHSGRIINISSISGQLGDEYQVSYDAAKGGVTNMTRGLARDLGPYGITVNCIGPGLYPGPIYTPNPDPDCYPMYRRTKIVLGRTGIEGDMDGMLLYLASDYATYTTGQYLIVDGGLTAAK